MNHLNLSLLRKEKLNMYLNKSIIKRLEELAYNKV